MDLFQFHLPTGTQVVVYISRWYEWHNVHVIPCAEDYQSTGGVCGYISAPGRTEFRLRDGTVTSNRATFADDWYVYYSTS